ncbi:C-C motif chemokine 27b [Clupea harengus]|uniref:C-C motif chemokine 27b n=1 Tax=Clupea harengus TaxID=7950 RepID=A0A6P8EQ45_CLUHA|nr:C-C motif chemokine 27b [Clupea harengus]
MDLRGLALILFLSLPTIGAIPKCCVEISPKVPLNILMMVDKYDVQSSQGVCDIDAIKLHVKGKRYCAHPKVLKILQVIEVWRGQRKAHTSWTGI